MAKKEYYEQHEIDFPTYNRELLDRLLIDASPIVQHATERPIHIKVGQVENEQRVDAKLTEKILEVAIRQADAGARSYRLDYSDDGSLSVLRDEEWQEANLANSATAPLITDAHRAIFLLIAETTR